MVSHDERRSPVGVVANLLSVGLLCFMPAGLQAAGLELASDTWPPFTDQPEKPHVALEIVHTALERAGIEAETDIRDFGELMQDLRAGELDGSAALWRDEERESFLIFSEPYLENRLVLVGAKGSDVGATDFGALKGHTVALVGSYSYGIDESSGPDFVRGASVQANLEGLLAGRVDYMLVDELVIQYLQEYHPEETEQNLAIGSTPLVTRSLHFAIRKSVSGAEEVIEAFNQKIREMQRDGTYNRILHLSWIRVDVDGDGSLEMVLAGDDAGSTRPTHGYDLFTYKNPGLSAHEQNQEYVIEGNRYEGWEQIPDAYKRYDSRFESPSRSDDGLFGLKF